MNRIGLPLSLLVLFEVCVAGDARAQLKPEELAIIAVRNSDASQDVAEYYARARKVPQSRIFLIDVEPGKNLDRDRWEQAVRPAIRNWILKEKLESKVRCLVTVWDVPLKIGKSHKDLQARRAFLGAERQRLALAIVAAIEEVDAMSAENGRSPEKKDVQTHRITQDAKQLASQLQSALESARKRLAEAPAKDVQAANKRLVRLVETSGGVRSALRLMMRQKPSAAQDQSKIDNKIEFLKGRLTGLRDAKAALDQMPETVERDEQTLTIVGVAEGVLGSIAWLDAQLALLDKNETYASFDSELSLLFSLHYPLMRWRPNLLHYRYDGSPLRQRRMPMMVSRLETPSVELTKKLIDTSIAVEKTGLQGKVYLDARGLTGENPAQRGSYGEYDRALRKLAEILQQNTKLTIELDNEKALFQPGDCPNTGLYCGWYSLAKYVDAFEFNRGAVAYHIASSEASTLRNPKSQVWCKRMLEDGVCATLGPVYEPYLAAFPRPDEFFVMLLTGRYSLAECFYRTKPFNSWVMTLVGDPLYNPFGRAPAIERGELPEELRRLIEPHRPAQRLAE